VAFFGNKRVIESVFEMKSWQQNAELEVYLEHLDRSLIQKLRSTDKDLRKRRDESKRRLNRFSQEINEELNRVESLLNESLWTQH
jgi:hypothetical protein